MTEETIQTVLPYAPIPFRQAGKWTLAYETLLQNQTSRRWKLCEIKVTDTGSGRQISVWGEKEIAENSRFLQADYRPIEAEALDAGLVQLVYHWPTYDERADVPETLHHVFVLQDETGAGMQLETDVRVQQIQAPVIRPPLLGEGWLAADAATNFTGHRRTLIPVDGQPYFAQRYAVDWIRFGEDGMLVNGPAEKNECWYCYGAEIHAVADGVITMTQDGIVENVALGAPVIKITWETAAGNLIIQDIGAGQYAFYAHLLPGSLTVKDGDHVRAGQVIARLGNSGNSDAPHLHFHIGNRNSPLGAQGIPYHFAAYRSTGIAGTTDEIMQRLTEGKPWENAQAPALREDEMFASNEVVILE